MRDVELILVPYHAGESEVRVGKGPGRLLEKGLPAALRATGASVATTRIGSVQGCEGEIGKSFELKRRAAQAVAAAVSGGRFPLVLAGNCNTTVGVVAGLNDPAVGIVWFDAHTDFDTPDERTTGYFDGMGVATLAGQCWHGLTGRIPGFRPFDLSRFIYCGIRDFAPGQAAKVERHRVAAVYGSTIRSTDFAAELQAKMASRPLDRVAIHIDLDCLDISCGRANEYASSGGLAAAQLDACVAAVCAHAEPVALTIASFNPDLDRTGAISAAAIAAAVTVVRQLQA